MKQCSKCKKIKDYSEFYKEKNRKNGIRSLCKDCCKERIKKYQNENKEKITANHKRWHQQNKEKQNAKARQWYQVNKEKANRDHREWYKKNRITVLEKNKIYRQKKRETRLFLYPKKNKSKKHLVGRLRELALQNIRKYSFKSGEKHPNWKGGISKLRDKHSFADIRYKNWRKAIFERDDYTCQHCQARNGNGKEIYLEAHHIKEWIDYPELRFELFNGLTLCNVCHNKTKNPNKWIKKKVR